MGILKRVLDFGIAAIALAVSLPVFITISALIVADSGFPVFFSQRRVGHRQKKFTLYKFRTMVKDAEKIKHRYKKLDYTDGPVFKIRKDPRYTKIGLFLAKTSLDELPQLFNVLKGDMFIVGFRPPTPEEVKEYKEWQLERFKGYPGITSLWAISGMHNIRFDDWIKMDIKYSKKANFFLDMKIVAKTVTKIIENIYASLKHGL